MRGIHEFTTAQLEAARDLCERGLADVTGYDGATVEAAQASLAAIVAILATRPDGRMFS